MNGSANEAQPETEQTMAKGKGWLFIVIIAVNVVITQLLAYAATPSETMADRKYILNWLVLYTIVVQWVVFIHAGGFFGNERTEKYYDLTGSLTFLTTLAISIGFIPGTIQARQIVLSSFVAVWATRLGWFLFTRIHGSNGIDSRFTLIKQSRPRFLMAWTLQGEWVFVQLLPVLILNQSSKPVSFGVFDYIGIPIWVIGFGFEAVADYQKSAFRKSPENREKFISSGLWSISRHPNYFGEILLWLGIALSAFGGLGAGARAAFAFLSPVFVALLLIFVSGIPLLEEKADKKFGDSDLYKDYKRKTPVLVPFIGRAGNAKF